MPAGGVRAYELAKALQPHADVTLAVRGDTAPDLDVRCVTYSAGSPRELAPTVVAADAIVALPPWPPLMRLLARSRARLVFDMSDPQLFPTLLGFQGRKRELLAAMSIDRPMQAFRIGHHFTVGNERQRDLWIGALIAERLLQPELFDRDPSLRSVIDTVSTGIPSAPPRRTSAGGPRERFPQIQPEDKIVLWNGGLWDWFDGETAVRAVGLLAERRPGVRLIFMSATRHAYDKRATADARSLAAQLGILDRNVLFNDDWVPYKDIANWLLDADVGLATHVDHLETRYATRNRMLDCYWAGLPIVVTRGVELADRIEREDLGATVPERDEHALAAALERVLDRGRDAYADRLARAAADHAWPVTAEPLIRYVTSSEPPRRLREDLGSRLVTRPSQHLRTAAYRAGRFALNALGKTRRPAL